MKKWVITLFLYLFPAIALAAEGSLSFAPPAVIIRLCFLGICSG